MPWTLIMIAMLIFSHIVALLVFINIMNHGEFGGSSWSYYRPAWYSFLVIVPITLEFIVLTSLVFIIRHKRRSAVNV